MNSFHFLTSLAATVNYHVYFLASLAPSVTVDHLAFDPVAIPGIGDRLNRLGGWGTWVAYFACILGFTGGGGYLAFDKMTDHGGNKGPKIALGAVIGSIVVASATTVISAASA